MILDGKRTSTFTGRASLVTAAVGVPIWLTVVLPLSVAYQTARKVLGSDSEEEVEVESSQVEDEVVSFPTVSELKPLEDRKYDIVVLGCTGFTGGLVASYLAKNYNGKVYSRLQKRYDCSLLCTLIFTGTVLY